MRALATSNAAAGALWHMAATSSSKAAIVRTGGIPRLVSLLHRTDTPEARESAAAVLAELARAGSQKVIVASGGIAPLVALMGSSNVDVCEQAVWAIGNIAGDCPAMRDQVLANGAIERVLKMIEVCALMLPPPPFDVRVCAPLYSEPTEAPSVPRADAATERPI